MEQIFAVAIYCDDIRQEIGGKHSFMGVYNADLVVLELPTSLLKFCIHVRVQFPVDTIAERLRIKVFDNETVIAEVSIPDGTIQEARASIMSAAATADSNSLAFATMIQFTSMQLKEPTSIRVWAIVDDIEIKANGLRVRLPTELERSTTQPMIPGVS